MSETPKVIKAMTPEEYRNAPREKLIELSSGSIFKCRRPNPEAVLTYMIINENMPKSEGDKPLENKVFYKFMKDNYKVILNEIVLPSIIEPKLAPEDLLIEDVIELSTKILEMAGLNDEEKKVRERFRPKPSG